MRASGGTNLITRVQACLALALLAGCGSSQDVPSEALATLSACGDGICAVSETCSSCAGDCGSCNPVCGDAVCDAGEDCLQCPGDCGNCGPVCGDAVCDNSENCMSCPGDCGNCGPVCGDAVCDASEDCVQCPVDCGSCGPVCGDTVCDAGEDCVSCPGDCGSCGPVCGDTICEQQEDCTSCVSDCGACEPIDDPLPTDSYCESAAGRLKAFPGAEGFGAFAQGGRNGAVLFVTNTRDSGPGSLRAAIETAGPRTVVFKTGGHVDLSTMLVVREPYLTIAAQTAPGNGFVLRRGGLVIAAHDVIVRGLRVRPGDHPEGVFGSERDGINISSTETGAHVYGVIVDHSSVSWGVDENLATWTDKISDVTVQWSILAEALRNSIHVDEGATEPGPHSMGMLLAQGSARISVHHNLLAHNEGRNPRIDDMQHLEFVNNVIYNYGAGPTTTSPGPNTINLQGNYYRLGVDSRHDTFVFSTTPAAGTVVWLQGNVRDSVSAAPAIWETVNGDASIVVGSPAFAPAITSVDSANDAYAAVLSGAGAQHPVRDTIDARIVASVTHRTGNIIDSQDEVGGWEADDSGLVPADEDHDGIPDEWERAHGFDPGTFDSGVALSQGCSRLEAYLNSLYLSDLKDALHE